MSVGSIFKGFEHILAEVLTALSPVLVLFVLFLFFFRMPRSILFNLFKGTILAFAGLALFLQGVKTGFMPVGMEIGAILGSLPNRWILIPLGFLLGFLATLAEPAVRILSNQVERSSSGYIRSVVILFTLCLAVGLFIALAMTRVVYGIPFYYIIIPGYLLAIVLMRFSKPSFTAIAFDSGGVATGPMTVTFIMALAVGAADSIAGRDAVIDGFGLVALVALAPIIMIMLLGFFYSDQEEDPALEEDTAEALSTEPDHDGELSPDSGIEADEVVSPQSSNLENGREKEQAAIENQAENNIAEVNSKEEFENDG